MKPDENTTAELAFLFKLLPVIHEVESIDRIHRFLLATVTAGRTIGYRRAVILVADETNGVLRGRYGVERPARPAEEPRKKLHFEQMARGVFDVFENVEQTELTLSARAFTVPLDRHQSALIKALRTSYPVLAERQLSEFEQDEFLEFLASPSYIAVPLRVGDRTQAVLAVDRGDERRAGESDDISLLYSLAQQASEACSRLARETDHKRRMRILARLQQELAAAGTHEGLEESLQMALLMIGRAVGADGCMIKDLTSEKSLHVKSVQEYSPKSEQMDIAISECMDNILDRAAGRMEPVEGASDHPLLPPTVAKHLVSFYACPLVASGDVAGALVVYFEQGAGASDCVLTVEDKRFVELCAGILASRLDGKQKRDRYQRVEDCLGELTSNLSRERERSRIGEHAVEFFKKSQERLGQVEELLSTRQPYAKRFPKIAELVRAMRADTDGFRRTVLSRRTRYEMTDLFAVTRGIVEVWQEATDLKDITVTVEIPDRGPRLLMDRKRIAVAVASILATTRSYLKAGNRLRIECSVKDAHAHICIADTGEGLPGDAMSRLFMPFDKPDELDDTKRALSLAAEIIQKHSGDVIIKSAGGWNTILILSFPLSANRDRRRLARDRRQRRERRQPVTSA